MGLYDTKYGKYATSGPDLVFYGPTPIEDEGSIIEIIFLLLKKGVKIHEIRIALKQFIGKEPPQLWFEKAYEKLQLDTDPKALNPFESDGLAAHPEEPTFGM